MQRPWMTNKMPWEQSVSEWQASLPSWLLQLINLTPPQREQRLTALGWYGTPELRLKIVQGAWEQLKADHEAQVHAWLDIQAAPLSQPETQPACERSPLEPGTLESVFWRRPELVSEFKTFWAEIDSEAAEEEAQAAAAAAQVAAGHAEAEERGFSYPVDSTQGVPFEEALAWTVGCVGRNKKGYKTEEGFRKWLQRMQYRYLDTGRITSKGFALMLRRDRKLKCDYQTSWKRAHKQPANQSTDKDQASANQDPKPVNKDSTPRKRNRAPNF